MVVHAFHQLGKVLDVFSRSVDEFFQNLSRNTVGTNSGLATESVAGEGGNGDTQTNTEICKALAGLRSYAHSSREEMCADNLLVVGVGVDCATRRVVANSLLVSPSFWCCLRKMDPPLMRKGPFGLRVSFRTAVRCDIGGYAWQHLLDPRILAPSTLSFESGFRARRLVAHIHKPSEHVYRGIQRLSSEYPRRDDKRSSATWS